MVDTTMLPGKSPLAGFTPATAAPPTDEPEAVIMTDTGVFDKINLRCDASNPVMIAHLAKVVGCPLPEANRFNSSGDRRIIWTGPNEWLITAEKGVASKIIPILDTAEAGHVAVTEVSNALGGITLDGESARLALAKHCAIDLDESVFLAGHSAVTLLGLAAATLLCVSHSSFTVLGRSSFMPYIAALLEDSCLEYGFSYHASE